jgi:selenocysteine lyase/cysteine desulfurase
MTLSCQKYLFDLPADLHFLNCSTVSPNLISSVEAGQRGMARKSQPQSITSHDFFTDVTETKSLFAQLINCADPERIAIIPSASYGMATVAKNLARKPGLRAGQEIVLVFEEFPSDVLAWEEVAAGRGLLIRTVSPPADADARGQRWNEALLAAITDQTCLVVVPHAHWTDGTRFDLVSIRARTREVGAWLVVDAAQSLGVMPFDVQQIQPDALITVGYKYLLGPYGISASYWSETFDDGLPLEQNWINRLHSEDFGGLVNYQREYRPKAARYGMGEQSNFILLPMLNASLRQLLDWQPARIADYCGALTNGAADTLRDLGFWVEAEAWRSQHLMGIRPPAGVDMDDIRAALTARNISLSIRSTALRVSTHVWNTPADLLALTDALGSVVGVNS